MFFLFCILVGSLLAPPPPLNKRFKLCLNHFLVQSSAKESLRSAKNVVFSLFCILVGRPMEGAIAPPLIFLSCYATDLFHTCELEFGTRGSKLLVFGYSQSWIAPFRAFSSNQQSLAYVKQMHSPAVSRPNWTNLHGLHSGRGFIERNRFYTIVVLVPTRKLVHIWGERHGYSLRSLALAYWSSVDFADVAAIFFFFLFFFFFCPVFNMSNFWKDSENQILYLLESSVYLFSDGSSKKQIKF